MKLLELKETVEKLHVHYGDLEVKLASGMDAESDESDTCGLASCGVLLDGAGTPAYVLLCDEPTREALLTTQIEETVDV